MGLNLLELIKGEVSSGAVDKISNYLGESRSATSNAISGAVPLILLHLSNKSKTERGAEDIMSFASDNSINALFDGNSFQETFEKNRDSLLSKGNALKSTVFSASDKDQISKGISKYANISTESVDGTFSAILPLIIGALKQKIEKDNLSNDSLSSAFDDERYLAALPAALTANLNTNTLSSRDEVASVNKTAAAETVATTKQNTNTKTNTSMKEQDDRKVYIKEDEDKGGIMKWLLPLLALVLGIIALIFLLKRCDNEEVVTTEDKTKTPVLVDSADVDNDGMEEVVDVKEIKGTYNEELNSFMYDTGAERTITLPDGTTFTVGEASTEAKIYDFLSNDALLVSDDKTVGWVTMDRIYFALNKATLIPDSEQQLNNVVSILKNFPNTEVKFGGYTDNQGGQEINQPLSEARAKSALDFVVAKGIDASRLASEGYGQDHFICPANDSKECRAKNRRVDIRITKK